LGRLGNRIPSAWPWPYLFLLRPKYKSSIELQKPKAYSHSPTFPKPLLAVGRNVNERPTIKGIQDLYYKEYLFERDLETDTSFDDSITKPEFSKSCKNNLKCSGSGIGINVFETWGF
jgi:hypothetical protein